MLTSYLVKCPHFDCNFFGSLLPSRDTDSWKSSLPTVNVAVFSCPNCGREWKARVKGDDVIPLPIEDEITMA
jgi:hypothetical protein